MLLFVLGVVHVPAFVAWVADLVILTVAAMLIVWGVVGPPCDWQPEMFLPRGLPLELLVL